MRFIPFAHSLLQVSALEKQYAEAVEAVAEEQKCSEKVEVHRRVLEKELHEANRALDEANRALDEAIEAQKKAESKMNSMEKERDDGIANLKESQALRDMAEKQCVECADYVAGHPSSSRLCVPIGTPIATVLPQQRECERARNRAIVRETCVPVL